MKKGRFERCRPLCGHVPVLLTLLSITLFAVLQTPEGDSKSGGVGPLPIIWQGPRTACPAWQQVAAVSQDDDGPVLRSDGVAPSTVMSVVSGATFRVVVAAAANSSAATNGSVTYQFLLTKRSRNEQLTFGMPLAEQPLVAFPLTEAADAEPVIVTGRGLTAIPPTLPVNVSGLTPAVTDRLFAPTVIHEASGTILVLEAGHFRGSVMDWSAFAATREREQLRGGFGDLPLQSNVTLGSISMYSSVDGACLAAVRFRATRDTLLACSLAPSLLDNYDPDFEPSQVYVEQAFVAAGTLAQWGLTPASAQDGLAQTAACASRVLVHGTAVSTASQRIETLKLIFACPTADGEVVLPRGSALLAPSTRVSSPRVAYNPGLLPFWNATVGKAGAQALPPLPKQGLGSAAVTHPWDNTTLLSGSSVLLQSAASSLLLSSGNPVFFAATPLQTLSPWTTPAPGTTASEILVYNCTYADVQADIMNPAVTAPSPAWALSTSGLMWTGNANAVLPAAKDGNCPIVAVVSNVVLSPSGTLYFAVLCSVGGAGLSAVSTRIVAIDPLSNALVWETDMDPIVGPPAPLADGGYVQTLQLAWSTDGLVFCSNRPDIMTQPVAGTATVNISLQLPTMGVGAVGLLDGSLLWHDGLLSQYPVKPSVPWTAGRTAFCASNLLLDDLDVFVVVARRNTFGDEEGGSVEALPTVIGAEQLKFSMFSRAIVSGAVKWSQPVGTIGIMPVPADINDAFLPGGENRIPSLGSLHAGRRPFQLSYGLDSALQLAVAASDVVWGPGGPPGQPILGSTRSSFAHSSGDNDNDSPLPPVSSVEVVFTCPPTAIAGFGWSFFFAALTVSVVVVRCCGGVLWCCGPVWVAAWRAKKERAASTPTSLSGLSFEKKLSAMQPEAGLAAQLTSGAREAGTRKLRALTGSDTGGLSERAPLLTAGGSSGGAGRGSAALPLPGAAVEALPVPGQASATAASSAGGSAGAPGLPPLPSRQVSAASGVSRAASAASAGGAPAGAFTTPVGAAPDPMLAIAAAAERVDLDQLCELRMHTALWQGAKRVAGATCCSGRGRRGSDSGSCCNELISALKFKHGTGPWILVTFVHKIAVAVLLTTAVSNARNSIADLNNHLEDPYSFTSRYLINRSPTTFECRSPAVGACYCDPTAPATPPSDAARLGSAAKQAEGLRGAVAVASTRSSVSSGPVCPSPSWWATSPPAGSDAPIPCSFDITPCQRSCDVVLEDTGNCAASVFEYSCGCGPNCASVSLNVSSTRLRTDGRGGLPAGLEACRLHYASLDSVLLVTYVINMGLAFVYFWYMLGFKFRDVLGVCFPSCKPGGANVAGGVGAGGGNRRRCGCCRRGRGRRGGGDRHRHGGQGGHPGWARGAAAALLASAPEPNGWADDLPGGGVLPPSDEAGGSAGYVAIGSGAGGGGGGRQPPKAARPGRGVRRMGIGGASNRDPAVNTLVYLTLCKAATLLGSLTWSYFLVTQGRYCTGADGDGAGEATPVIGGWLPPSDSLILRYIPGCSFGSAWQDLDLEGKVLAAVWLSLAAQSFAMLLVLVDDAATLLTACCMRWGVLARTEDAALPRSAKATRTLGRECRRCREKVIDPETDEPRPRWGLVLDPEAFCIPDTWVIAFPVLRLCVKRVVDWDGTKTIPVGAAGYGGAASAEK